jgi:hypothetical protein
MTHWLRVRKELLEGSYRPSPVRKVEIPKLEPKKVKKVKGNKKGRIKKVRRTFFLPFSFFSLFSFNPRFWWELV